jgi:hypothetical protein
MLPGRAAKHVAAALSSNPLCVTMQQSCPLLLLLLLGWLGAALGHFSVMLLRLPVLMTLPKASDSCKRASEIQCQNDYQQECVDRATQSAAQEIVLSAESGCSRVMRMLKKWILAVKSNSKLRKRSISARLASGIASFRTG